jgi:hypothetical protein
MAAYAVESRAVSQRAEGLGWIIEPIIKKLPCDSLLSTLDFDTALVRSVA